MNNNAIDDLGDPLVNNPEGILDWQLNVSLDSASVIEDILEGQIDTNIYKPSELTIDDFAYVLKAYINGEYGTGGDGVATEVIDLLYVHFIDNPRGNFDTKLVQKELNKRISDTNTQEKLLDAFTKICLASRIIYLQYQKNNTHLFKSIGRFMPAAITITTVFGVEFISRP